MDFLGSTLSLNLLNASSCMPQGDPWGPLALQMWMSSGIGFVNDNLPLGLHGGVDRVYVDDHSFSLPTPEGLLAKKALWTDWSEKIGLVENGSKVHDRNA